jgi:hypothetical protein
MVTIAFSIKVGERAIVMSGIGGGSDTSLSRRLESLKNQKALLMKIFLASHRRLALIFWEP